MLASCCRAAQSVQHSDPPRQCPLADGCLASASRRFPRTSCLISRNFIGSCARRQHGHWSQLSNAAAKQLQTAGSATLCICKSSWHDTRIIAFHFVCPSIETLLVEPGSTRSNSTCTAAPQEVALRQAGCIRFPLSVQNALFNLLI
jgi:hypothetical protein